MFVDPNGVTDFSILPLPYNRGMPEKEIFDFEQILVLAGTHFVVGERYVTQN